MRYELYGILGASGANTFKGAFPSLRKALLAAQRECHELVFAILERQRKYSIPTGINAGRNGTLLRSTMLCSHTGNPIKDPEKGAEYWKGWFQ